MNSTADIRNGRGCPPARPLEDWPDGECCLVRRALLPSSRALGSQCRQPRRGGTLRVRGYDPPHFDPHLTLNFKTNTTLSFVYNKLVRHKVGAGIQPGTFTLEPDLAERWEALDDTTYVFHATAGSQMAQ